MSESRLRSQLTGYLRKCNAIVIPHVPTKYSTPGVPDIQVIHWRWSGFIETKLETNTLSPAQERFQALSLERGYPCVCLTFLHTRLTENILVKVSCDYLYTQGHWEYPHYMVEVKELLSLLQGLDFTLAKTH